MQFVAFALLSSLPSLSGGASSPLPPRATSLCSTGAAKASSDGRQCSAAPSRRAAGGAARRYDMGRRGPDLRSAQRVRIVASSGRHLTVERSEQSAFGNCGRKRLVNHAPLRLRNDCNQIADRRRMVPNISRSMMAGALRAKLPAWLLAGCRFQSPVRQRARKSLGDPSPAGVSVAAPSRPAASGHNRSAGDRCLVAPTLAAWTRTSTA